MKVGCQGCRDGAGFDIPFSMAFQPIVDLESRTVFAHEALVRGLGGEGAGTILSQVNDGNKYAFDQQCRAKAIELARDLGGGATDTKLSINFIPNAVYEPRACIRLTLATATRVGFPLNRIIFEFTEVEKIDTDHLLNILRTYKDIGFLTAIDDFGAGHSGLNLLASFQPDIVKLDMGLIRGIDTDRSRRVVVKHTLAMLLDFGIKPICEGVETIDELKALQDIGVTLVQGYLFGRPAFESLLPPDLQMVA
ncbi:EAL domain-containing protein [Neorhizobium lilium]|uniref:EAL domain-containing protein n=1 Tax=Neorhizobium lilium TaxID=2503024 RepID=A0A444LJL1_9HYPH|nr:EAL domain-containing protein [Neorhizobium lilium]RWX79165.1 EAL domain-containing protein [Neorhizobium lilium]